MSLPPIPGVVWFQKTAKGTLRVIRVTARNPVNPDHFVLTMNNVPIVPQCFARAENAARYAEREWVDLGTSVLDAN